MPSKRTVSHARNLHKPKKIRLTKTSFWPLLNYCFREKEKAVLTDVLQQMIDIVYGARAFLPETKIIIGVAIGLALLIYFKGTVGSLVTSVLVTILVAESFFSQGDIYQISVERALAGVVLGLIAFLTNLYFILRTLTDWKD
jgi:hypothetical protein